MPAPLLLAMFDHRISGDHHLLELAQRRFTAAQIGAEFYPTDLQDLQETLEFRPRTEPRYTMHLPRDIRLLAEGRGVDFITAFAARSRTDAYGMIIHDQPEMATRRDEYLDAVRALNDRLLEIEQSPYLFIEYAVGLDIDSFVSFFERAKDCERISACLDISHLGIQIARQVYAETYPGEDICHLHPDHPDLPAKIDDVITACAWATPIVLDVIRGIGRLGKPIHFHLHDGQPLSTLSPFGVSDHLSFTQEIRLPFEYKSDHTVPLLFGRSGLTRIVNTALETLPKEKLSFMIEVHPQFDRLDLGDDRDLFINWVDKANAEMMNSWLELLLLNIQFLREAISKAKEEK